MNKYDESDIFVLVFYYLTITFIVGYAIGLLVVGKYIGLLLLSIAIIFGYLYGKEEYEYYIFCKNNKDKN